MTAIRIIGIGSPFGSDRIGWDAIDACPQVKDIGANEVSFISLDRPGVGLLDYMQGAETVILIDAVKTGMEPGSVVRFENEQINSTYSGVSTHSIGVAEAIALGRVLKNLPGQVVLIGMEVGEEPEWMPLCKDMEVLVKAIAREIEGSIRPNCRVGTTAHQ